MFCSVISSARMRQTLLIHIGNEAVKRCYICGAIAPVTFSPKDQGVKVSLHCGMTHILFLFSASYMCEGKNKPTKTFTSY